MECSSIFNDVYACTLVIFRFLLCSTCKKISPWLRCVAVQTKVSACRCLYFITPNPLECNTEYLRVSVAEWLDADQHPDVIPGLELTLAPLYFVVVCKELISPWSNEDADSGKAQKYTVCSFWRQDLLKFKPWTAFFSNKPTLRRQACQAYIFIHPKAL